MRVFSVLALACVCVACSTPESRRQELMAGPVGDRRILVQPFTAAVAAEGCPSSFNGSALASSIVTMLKKRGAPAELSTGDSGSAGTLVVNGAITVCNAQGQGGEGFSYGAAGKVFEGEREVGEFRGYHFCEYGVWAPTAEGRGDTCMTWVANVIAATIVEGNFAEATAAAIEEEQRAYGVELASENQKEVIRRAQSMIITTGPIAQQYVIQGPIEFDSIGMINYGNLLSDALFVSPLERAVRGPLAVGDINWAFNGLRYKAAMRYPDANGVINATYLVDKRGVVYANGLAVQIAGGAVSTPAAAAAAPARATDERLRAAKDLFDQGLITQKEYEKKRAEIIGDL